MEVALAVPPLVLGAIKGYSSVRKRCKGMGHFPIEVQLARDEFNRKYKIFVNETMILFRMAALEDSQIAGMMDEAEHDGWKSPEVEHAVRSFLGDSYEAYRSAITVVCTTIQDLDIDLSQYERLSSKRQKGERLNDTARRLGYQIKIGWSKDKFQSGIETIRKVRDELETLRRQVSELKRLETAHNITTHRILRRTQPCSNYRPTQEACRALHQMLDKSFEKAGQVHSARHEVRIFAGVQTDSSTVSEITIQCLPEHGAEGCAVDPKPPGRQYEIRSRAREWIEPSPTPPLSSDERETRPKKVRFCHSLLEDSESSTRQHASTSLPLTPDSSQDGSACRTPKKSQHLCFDLKEETVPALPGYKYLGYVDNLDYTDAGYRHSFYITNPRVSRPTETLNKYPSSVQEILKSNAERTISVPQQIRLARDIAATFLRFYSTPWMNQYITTNDFRYFITSASDIDACLKTLHLLYTFDNQIRGCSTADVDAMDRSVETARLRNGPVNITLWCLGVILLQIGLWENVLNVDDIGAVKDSLSACTKLGSKYQRITERCLSCNFGRPAASDLSKFKLQRAVHQTVVAELSGMVDWLESDTDDEDDD